MSTPSHYWLVTGQVVVRNKVGLERSRNMNALVKTEKGSFNRKNMAQAQESVARRFVTEIPQVKGFEIVDVALINVSFLGQMLPEEFHEGFEQPTADAPKPPELN